MVPGCLSGDAWSVCVVIPGGSPFTGGSQALKRHGLIPKVRRSLVTVLLFCLVSTGLTTAVSSVPAHATPAGQVPVVNSSAAQPSRLADPAKMLSPGWNQSADRIVAVQGDQSGLHVLVADEASGYEWQTVATLGDPGVLTSGWIGQACVTGDGQYAVVVYAPREVTNMAGAMGVLGRVAIVSLESGTVRQVGGGYSVAYFDPGCGTGDQAVLTRGGWGGDTSALPASTGLQMINASTGVTSMNVAVPGQATSPVPYQGEIAAAYGSGISEIGAGGQTRLLARTTGVPFRLVTDGAGGLGFETQGSGQVLLHRLAAGRVSQVGSAAEGTLQLAAQGGRVWVTGASSSALRGLSTDWRSVSAPAGSLVSTTGQFAATSVASVGEKSQQPGDPESVQIQGQLLQGSRARVKFTVPTTSDLSQDESAGKPLGPRAAAVPATAGSGTTPVSADRTCGIALDDPSIQAYQPGFNQVEWAADQAVQGTLTDTRAAELYGSALPSYTPQGMFPLPSLTGGGRIPAQVLLGVLTQESNLQQASVHVVQGQASNPLTSFNWYGNWIDSFTVESDNINWAASDCGYGIGQITSGMCLSQGANNDPECQYAAPLSDTDQLAVAVDYQANIAKAAQILADYWNQLEADHITVNGGESDAANYIDNWYMTLWAYNSGLEPGSSEYGNTSGCTPGPSCTDSNGDWGLGYADNPANPAYPPDRPVFPDGSASNYLAPGGNSYSPDWDMSHPQYWTYQEKVISWAFDSVTLFNYNTQSDQQAFAYASGNAEYPPTSDFCTSDDYCDPSVLNDTSPTASSDPCELTGSNDTDHCWWHWPVTWSGDCTSGSCGISVLTYSAGASAPADPTIATEFAPDCTLGSLPSDAVIVGTDESAMGCPGQDWTSAGSMTWNFGEDNSNDTYPSKIYLDQIGSGFGGHFWFSYTIPNDAYDPTTGNQPSTTTAPQPADADLKITGTWPAPSSVSGWTQIYAHIPVYGAWDPQANYQIYPGDNEAVQHSVVNQAQQANTWVSLGVFDLSAGASVSLSNVTYSGYGRDIAWNALAYVPSSKPAYDYVALGDSYSSGQGLTPYMSDSNYSYDGMTSECDRSKTQAYPDLVVAPGSTTSIADQAATPGSGYQFSFLACNGQWTTQITESAADEQEAPEYGQVAQSPMQNVPAWDSLDLGYGELPQADQGYLNANTNLVTMTTGGDDARFASVLETCIPHQTLTGSCDATLSGDPSALNVYEPEVIADLPLHLEQVYKTIATDAPNAEIIVIAYPNLFTDDQNSDGCLEVPYEVGPGLADWLNKMGDDMRTATETAVSWAISQGIDINMINADPAFEGHESCDSPYNWINYETAGFPAPGGGSFHPNFEGQVEFADLVDECLNNDIPSAYTIPADGTCAKLY